MFVWQQEGRDVVMGAKREVGVKLRKGAWSFGWDRRNRYWGRLGPGLIRESTKGPLFRVFGIYFSLFPAQVEDPAFYRHILNPRKANRIQILDVASCPSLAHSRC